MRLQRALQIVYTSREGDRTKLTTGDACVLCRMRATVSLPYECDDECLATDVRCPEQIQHPVMATLLLLSDVAFDLVLALKEAKRGQRLLSQR